MTSDILPYMYIYTVLVYEIKVQHKLCIKEKNPQLCNIYIYITMFQCRVYFWMGTHCMKYNSKWSREKNLWNVSNFSKRILQKIFKSSDTPASIFSYSIVVHSSTQPK